jgi:MFS family permease
LVGLFYYAYAPFSLVAGVAMDQLGPRRVVPIGCATLAVGAIMFSTGDPTIASIGRFVQGAGGVFALIGAAYLAMTYLPASRAATLIG